VTWTNNKDRITALSDKYNLLTLPVVDEDGKRLRDHGRPISSHTEAE